MRSGSLSRALVPWWASGMSMLLAGLAAEGDGRWFSALHDVGLTLSLVFLLGALIESAMPPRGASRLR